MCFMAGPLAGCRLIGFTVIVPFELTTRGKATPRCMEYAQTGKAMHSTQSAECSVQRVSCTHHQPSLLNASPFTMPLHVHAGSCHAAALLQDFTDLIPRSSTAESKYDAPLSVLTGTTV